MERRPLGGLTGEVYASFDLLAAVEGLGGSGCLAESPARVFARIKRTPVVELVQTLSLFAQIALGLLEEYVHDNKSAPESSYRQSYTNGFLKKEVIQELTGDPSSLRSARESLGY